MLVSESKWYSGINDGTLPSLLSCELPVSVKENADRKKKKKKHVTKTKILLNSLKCCMSAKSAPQIIYLKIEIIFLP